MGLLKLVAFKTVYLLP